MKKFSDCPQVLRDFLIYHETIKGQSQKTISEYYLDLRMFLRFMKLMRNDMPIQTRLDDIPIKDVDLARTPAYTSGPADERCGMGFLVMENFTDSLSVKSKVGRGTSVLMRKNLKS